MAEGLVKEGILAGKPASHTNKLRIAILKMIDAGLVDRQPAPGVKNAFRYRLRSQAATLRVVNEGGG